MWAGSPQNVASVRSGEVVPLSSGVRGRDKRSPAPSTLCSSPPRRTFWSVQQQALPS